jgi:hypothetical protein
MPRDPMTKITYDAPVGCVDLPAFERDGEPFSLWPCTECLPWHAEVIWHEEKQQTMTREWHAIGCPHFQDLIADEEPG